MPALDINILSVIVAAIANMIIGFVWYGPVLFAKKWMQLTGMSEEKMKSMNPVPLYLKSFIAVLIMYAVLAHFINLSMALTAFDGMVTAFWCWLGFITTVQFTSNIFSDKPRQLYYLDTGYQLVTTLVAGAILAAWR